MKFVAVINLNPPSVHDLAGAFRALADTLEDTIDHLDAVQALERLFAIETVAIHHENGTLCGYGAIGEKTGSAIDEIDAAFVTNRAATR